MADIHVKGVMTENMKMEATTNNQHEYVLDYPFEESYETQGTFPGGALGMALAACKGMVVRQYLMARDMGDYKVTVEVEADAPKNENKKFEFHAKTHVTIEGDLSDKELDKIKKIVDEECAIEHIITEANNTVETTYHKA